MSETPNTHSQSDPPLDSTIARDAEEKKQLPVNHSPEPWTLHPWAESNLDTCFEILSRSGDRQIIIGYLSYDPERGITRYEAADGALIIAAPRLLRALRNWSDCFTKAQSSKTPFTDARNEADALLADLQKAGVF